MNRQEYLQSMEKLENTLTERLCIRNGWEFGVRGDDSDYDIALEEVKWFLSQPEILAMSEALLRVLEEIPKAVAMINEKGIGFPANLALAGEKASQALKHS